MGVVCSFSRDLLALGGGVGDSDVQLLGSFHDGESLLGGDGLSDLSAISSVVHKEQINIFFISDYELSESIFEHVSGLVVLLASNFWHSHGSGELPSNTAVNSSGLSPGFADSHESIRLESVWVFSDLLDDFSLF